jgi:hypothetical protein
MQFKVTRTAHTKKGARSAPFLLTLILVLMPHPKYLEFNSTRSENQTLKSGILFTPLLGKR